MTRFNNPAKQTPQTVLATSSNQPTLLTGNNAPAFERTHLSELFLLGVSNFYGQDTFYEPGAKRDERYIQLIQQAVASDPLWVTRFLRWLRQDANMRTASIVGAVEAVRAMLKLKIEGGRIVISSVLQRADEPGEMLAYWLNNYGNSIPKPIKRGIADAAARLYNERNVIKYDTLSRARNFGSVLELTHPAPNGHFQKHLFPYLISKSKKRDNLIIPDELTMLVANQALTMQARTVPQVLLNTTRLRTAGMTWESAKSLAGKRIDDKEFWEAMIPTMGYMALLRNLRNFDQAGISNEVAQQVIAKLTDPDEVARSRQLPLRFLSAYRNVPSDRYKFPLAQALELCLGNVPQLPGRTLILIDTSGSMTAQMSDKSGLTYMDAAVTFGLALARRCEAVDVVSFSSSTMVFPEVLGETLLQSVSRWRDTGFNIGGGTNTLEAVRRHNSGHDRIICLTDEQYGSNGWGSWGGDPYASVSPHVPAITFNLAGYKAAQNASSLMRPTIGGLSDQAFQMIPIMEAGARQRWPF